MLLHPAHAMSICMDNSNNMLSHVVDIHYCAILSWRVVVKLFGQTSTIMNNRGNQNNFCGGIIFIRKIFALIYLISQTFFISLISKESKEHNIARYLMSSAQYLRMDNSNSMDHFGKRMRSLIRFCLPTEQIGKTNYSSDTLIFGHKC